jgi:hypothetical protein
MLTHAYRKKCVYRRNFCIAELSAVIRFVNNVALRSIVSGNELCSFFDENLTYGCIGFDDDMRAVWSLSLRLHTENLAIIKIDMLIAEPINPFF